MGYGRHLAQLIGGAAGGTAGGKILKDSDLGQIGNLLADAALGAVPLAGDLADVYFKAHRRNMKLLQKALGEPYIDVVEPLPARRLRCVNPRAWPSAGAGRAT